MRRAITAALMLGLLLPAGVAAQETDVPAPWDEDQVITVTTGDGRPLIAMSDEDFCRSMAWLLQLYADDGEPTEDQVASCAETVGGQLVDQAWLPAAWLPALEAGPTAADPTPKPTKRPRAAGYKSLAKRGWQRVVKAPDKYEGKRYNLWACITQFDAATGEDAFRGQASFKKQRYWFSDGVNAFFSGDAARLDQFVQDDIVFMKVVSLGSLSYDTQTGGNTSVPLFEVETIKRVRGSC